MMTAHHRMMVTKRTGLHLRRYSCTCKNCAVTCDFSKVRFPQHYLFRFFLHSPCCCSQVGSFDPFSDDPRFVIQKIQMCPVTGILAVGGSGGQLLIYDLKSTEERDSTEVIRVVSQNNLHFKTKLKRSGYSVG